MIFPLSNPMSYPYYTAEPKDTASVPLALVLVCHGAYLGKLKPALDSINSQRQDTACILVLDNCSFHDIPQGWTVVRGVFGCPNKARNAGLAEAAKVAAWCIFWDADNTMSNGYIAEAKKKISSASRAIGILSPDVIRVESGLARFSVRQPDRRTYWSGRERSLSDTCSAWRIEAVLQAGGFPDGNTMLDDYTLALAVTRLGWLVDKLEVPALLQDHNENRSSHAQRGEQDLWNNRVFHIVSPLAGRVDVLRAWSAAVHAMDLPPKTHITIVDDSGCRRFAKDVWTEVESLSHLTNVRSVRILEAPPKNEPVEGWEAIHRRVAMLYNLALSGDRSDMVLFWEDDVIPSSPDALRLLAEGFLPFTRLAGVGGCYASRCNPNVAVASLEKGRWGRMPQLSWLASQKQRVSVGMLGGGFTLWAGHYLAEALPLRVEPSLRLGWDGSLGLALGEASKTLYLDPRVHCEHRCR